MSIVSQIWVPFVQRVYCSLGTKNGYSQMVLKVPMKQKNNCCLFERLFKVKTNGVFLF